MQRPVMNPMFMEEKDAAANKRPAPKPRWHQVVRGWLMRGVKFVARTMFTSLFRGNAARLKIEDGTPLQRFIRAVLYRLAFVPVILVIFVTAMVFAVTHPPRALGDA